MTIIGDAGFKGRPNSAGEVDIVYAIIEHERKQGYGIEATQSLIDWALSNPEVKTITAKSLLNNIGSASILRKMKFNEIFRNEELIHWSLERNYG